MALTLDPATRVISVPQADLTLITGSLYELDTDQFRKDVFDLIASELYIWMPDAFQHNTEVIVAGTTFARTIEFINSYSITFTPDSQWSVRLAGSNNNIFDIENGILNQNQVQVIAQNSGGLINASITDQIVEGSISIEGALRAILAATAGKVAGAATTTVTIRDTADSKDRITATVDASGNRSAVILDLSD